MRPRVVVVDISSDDVSRVIIGDLWIVTIHPGAIC